MDKAKAAVELRYAYLVNHLDAVGVLPKLVAKGLVDADFHQKLQGKTRSEQVQVLLTEILRSPVPDWFDKFVQALEEGSSAHRTIAEELRKEYENVQKSPRPPTASQSSPGPPSPPGPSEGRPPLPSPSAPNPTAEAGGTSHQDDQPSTPGQEMNRQLQEATQPPAQPVKVAPAAENRTISCPQGNIDDIIDVSFAILVANENECKAVLNYFGMSFTMVTSDQPYTDAVLNCTFDSDPILAQNGAVEQKPAAGLTRCSDDYHTITINGKTGIIYQTASIGSGGRQGAMITTVQLLKDAKERRWPLEIIFVVGCTGGHGKGVENGQVIVPTKVIEYNRGKFETGDDGQPKRIMKPEMWPTSEKWWKSVPTFSIRDDRENGRRITMAEGDYDYCGDFVVKNKIIAEDLKNTISGNKMIDIEMEGVGVATAIKVAETLGFRNVPEFLIVKGISDNADGNKGATAPMLFFGKPYDAVYPDDRQVMAALQSVTLAVRAIHKRMEWKYRAASSWCPLL